MAMAKKAQKKIEQKDDEVMTEKNGIVLGHKDGVTISYQSELKSFVITMPNRPDIKYQVSEKLTGVPSKVLSYTDEQIDQRLFLKEKIQRILIEVNESDLTDANTGKFIAGIAEARTLHAEKMAERASINKVLGAILEGKEILQYGIPVKEIASDDPDKKKYAPSTFTGDVIHAGKHLVAVVENFTDDKAYIRIIESTRFPLTAQEHADRAKSIQAKMNIDPANIKSIHIQGVDHQVIENTKRYMAFNSKYEVSKVDYYRPKAENTKSKQTELAQ